MTGLRPPQERVECEKEATTAAKRIKKSEPFEFRTSCLKHIVLATIYEAYREWEEHDSVNWIDKLKPLVNLLTPDEKEYVAAHAWKLNRKYYDYISTKLAIKVTLDKIHR